MRKIVLTLLALSLALPLTGENTRHWRQTKYREFAEGTLTGVALRSDGEILLAPELKEFADPGLEFIWTMVQDEGGALYVGGGSPAKVLRINADGTATTIFESKELEVHALAVHGSTGTLYAATSPDGKIHRIPKKGEPGVFYEPETKYIWDLAVDHKGNLFAATGDKGKIFRITPDGKGTVFFESEETHIRSLTFSHDGQLLAGTEPSGLIYRIAPNGKAFVIYETGKKEVTALLADKTGNLYAASMGLKTTPPRTPSSTVPGQTVVTSSGTTVITSSNAATAQALQRGVPTPRIPFLMAGGSEVYKIAPDGFPEVLWSSTSELVYSLSLDGTNRVLAGGGNNGKLFAVDSPIRYSDLAKVASQQITALVRSHNDEIYLATANPGMLYRLGPSLATEGVIESGVFDAELFTQWGRISWQSRGASNGDTDGSIRLFTRSGNTSDPNTHWSDWSEAYTDSSGSVITSPSARFLQWKAVLKAFKGNSSSLSSVSVAYLRRNLPPTVETIVVQRPGIRVRNVQTSTQSFESAQLELPPPTARQSRKGKGVVVVQAQSNRQNNRFQTPPQGAVDAGARSVVWSADDPNNDNLAFSVYYRGEKEKQWKLLEENLTANYYSWDRTTLPDGAYYLRVVATDAPANPADLALFGENVSDRFEVDNTAPQITGLAAQSNSTTEIHFTARDSFSPLEKAEYSLDAGEWQMIFPTSRTTDATEHSYEFRLGDLSPGEHTLVVRVYDNFRNVTLARTTFTIH
jgi:hypothetical protein